MRKMKDMKIFAKVNKQEKIIFNMEYQTCITIRLLRHRFYNDAKFITFRRISPILFRNWSFL